MALPSVFSSSLQTNTTNTTVVVTQPAATTTTYVQPTKRRSNESIPTISLVITIIHIFVCLSTGNIFIFGCLLPALICAIVVSSDLMHTSGDQGWARGWGPTFSWQGQVSVWG